MTYRSFAGVLLRRVLDKFADKLQHSNVVQLRSKLLEAWSFEQSPPLLRRYNYIFAQLAGRGDWNDFLPHLLTLTNKGGNNTVSALEIIEIISEYSPDQIFANISILGSFLGGLMNSSEPKVAIACARTTAACIVAIDDEGARSSFKPALDPIISILGNALHQGQEADAASIIEHLISIAQVQALFFKGALETLVRAMLSILSATSLEFSTRSIALELLVTLCESAPALARRCVPFMEGLFPAVVQLMLEVQTDDKEWLAMPYAEESIEENYTIGEEALERLAAGLGGKTVIPIVLSMMTSLASSSDWTHRRAAVAALTRLAEGASKLFQPHLSSCTAFLLASLHDCSVRVQFEAEQAIGQLALLYPDAVPLLASSFLPRLIQLLQGSDASSPKTESDRVRGHAASAMINLCNPDSIEADVLQPYLEPILIGIVHCLQHSASEIQSPCLVLLGYCLFIQLLYCLKALI